MQQQIVAHERVRMLRLDVELAQTLRREIIEIERHQNITAASNGGGEHMQVIGIGQRQSVNEAFVPGDGRVRKRQFQACAQ